jgi:hypothetical protein
MRFEMRAHFRTLLAQMNLFPYPVHRFTDFVEIQCHILMQMDYEVFSFYVTRFVFC